MPHCSLFHQELDQLIACLLQQGRDPVTELVLYTSEKSYPDEGNFVRVWNSGTPEFQDVQPVFERLAFSQVAAHCSSLRASDRGNRQDALGFSSQNLAERCPITSVSIPGMNHGMLDFQDEFAKMSALSALLSVSQRGMQSANMELFHFTMFAVTIHHANIFEGKYLLFAWSIVN